MNFSLKECDFDHWQGNCSERIILVNVQLCLVLEVEPTRILLVEDDPLNVEMFQLALNNYNERESNCYKQFVLIPVAVT